MDIEQKAEEQKKSNAWQKLKGKMFVDSLPDMTEE